MSSSPKKRVRPNPPSQDTAQTSENRDKVASHPSSKSTISSRNKPNATEEPSPSSSPYMGMFQTFRTELDMHHDRRERVIKVSRDVTALSKKMIFTLQRTPSICSPLPGSISKDITPKETTISTLLSSVYPADLSGLNAWRYQRQISPGIQEYIEALVFRHYLVTGNLISYDEAMDVVNGLLTSNCTTETSDGIMEPEINTGGEEAMDTKASSTTDNPNTSNDPATKPALLTEEDYLLGIFDAVGELMRWSITHLALTRSSSSDSSLPSASLLHAIRSLRLSLESLKLDGSSYEWAAEKKMDVMRTCVEKVENAVYGLVVRGSERPVEWVPDDTGSGEGVVAVEGY